MKNNKIPVFFVDGILDSGKTTFIIDTIKGDFKDYDIKTLLLVCEQGEVEYEEEFLKSTKTIAKYFDSIEDFDYKLIQFYLDEYKPDRVVIEMNGMWDLKKLQFPRQLAIAQFITFIDATTFPVYFNNMRQMFVDIIQRSHIVCFTKTSSIDELAPYQTALKLISNKAQFFVMDESLQAKEAFEEALPYDIDAPIICIKEEDYGRFYIDTFEHKDRYSNKVIELDTMVIKSDKLPKNQFIAGRFIMNCCANDIQLFGFIADTELGANLKDRQSIHLKAKITYEWSSEYQEEELVLHPISIKPLLKPLEDVLNLTN